MAAHEITHDAFLRHSDFLRRVARDLLGETPAAEDAVQDVWVRALERPPRHGANVRGWLRVVLANLVRSGARAESRRPRTVDADLEAAEASPRTEPEDALRSVTDAVLELEEPLRSTLLDHYFRGLSAAEIARRGNVPVTTVRSRLQRAVETLRARMERRGGDSWRRALIVLAPPIGRPSIVTTKVALWGSVAVVACLVVVPFVARRASTEGEAIEGLASATIAPRAEKTTVLEPVAQPAADPRLPVGATGLDVPPEGSPEILFFGTLRDPQGTPLRGLWSAGVTVTDALGRRRTCDAKEQGAFAFPGLAAGRYWVGASADGYGRLETVVDLAGGPAQVERDLTLAPLPILRVRVSTPDGSDFLARVREKKIESPLHALVPVATREPPGPWFLETVGSLNNPFGIGQFWQYGPRAEALPSGHLGILMIHEPLPAYASLVSFHRVLQTKRVEPGDEEVEFVLSAEEYAAELATIRMRVVDADTLAPIEGAHAMLSGGSYSDAGRVSDADGAITIADREPGEFQLHVRATGRAEHVARILAETGRPTDLGEIRLEKAVDVVARVVDAEGRPVSADFSLQTRRTTRYRSSGDGILELPALGPHRHVLRTSRLDWLNDETGWVSGNVVLDLRSGVAPVGLVITLRPATRLVLVVSGASARDLRFEVTDDAGLELVSGRFYGHEPRPLGLPPGTYRVTIRNAAGDVLAEKPVALGTETATLEFAL